MELDVKVTPQVEDANFLINIFSGNINLSCYFSARNNSKNLEILFPENEGLNACVFTMESGDIDSCLLKNAHKPIGERWYHNAIVREKDEFQLQLPNTIIRLKYDEALEFYKVVDRLNDEMKKLSLSVTS